jgi:hypothetical protein
MVMLGLNTEAGDAIAREVLARRESERESLEWLVDAAMLWVTGHGGPELVIDAAVDALAGGVDSISLARLAGATRRSAWHEVPDL